MCCITSHRHQCQRLQALDKDDIKCCGALRMLEHQSSVPEGWGRTCVFLLVHSCDTHIYCTGRVTEPVCCCWGCSWTLQYLHITIFFLYHLASGMLDDDTEDHDEDRAWRETYPSSSLCACETISRRCFPHPLPGRTSWGKSFFCGSF